MNDTFGITILASDRVRVLAYGRGGARLADCGTASGVLALRSDRVVILDADLNRRSVRSCEVGVLRRDGENGYEGNRQTETEGS